MVSKKVKIWSAVIAGAVVLGAIGNAINPNDAPDTVASIPSVAASSPSPSATPSTKPNAETAAEKSAPKQVKLAADVEKLWLEYRMVEKPSDILTTNPGSLAGYISSFEDVAAGTIEITVQENAVTKDELKQLSQSTFSLIGSDFPDLERVEVVTADRLTRAVSNRREVPLLNQ